MAVYGFGTYMFIYVCLLGCGRYSMSDSREYDTFLDQGGETIRCKSIKNITKRIPFCLLRRFKVKNIEEEP